MTLDDVFQAVTKKIATAFPSAKIYGEEVQQGLKYPAFFVYLVPIINSNETERRTYSRVSIKIVYMLEKKSNSAYRKMTDDLNKLFKLYFPAGDRVLEIYDKTSQVIDDSLNFSFDVSFYEIEFAEQYELMQTLQTDI
ncbi:phage tail terminator family protein [Aneurinibacillus migulanus]|uniref:phage tail terminator family protein n=1 Tax=Aneurinibacillus migulanus TaxID=47500 RepID=UPI0020A1C573|nr:hypothetical protein [Aneurinibacillus migulanus]MCP1355087.1 hypothetical protein [Aneurinibacillus migulanus]